VDGNGGELAGGDRGGGDGHGRVKHVTSEGWPDRYDAFSCRMVLPGLNECVAVRAGNGEGDSLAMGVGTGH